MSTKWQAGFATRLSFSLSTTASTDESAALILKVRERDPRIGIVELSRNFGKEIAMTAGLDYASGDAVVVIDADLQDPPEVIPQFVERWEAGYDVVFGRRQNRLGRSALAPGLRPHSSTRSHGVSIPTYRTAMSVTFACSVVAQSRACPPSVNGIDL